MSDENAAITATLKAGTGYDSPWLVVRADTPDQMVQLLDKVAESGVLAKLVNTSAELIALNNVNAGLGGKAVQVEAAAGNVTQGPWTQQGTSPARPAPAPQAQAAPGPSCQHGPMTFRQSKPGAAKVWKGYFCPTPQGTPDQCPPQFIR